MIRKPRRGTPIGLVTLALTFATPALGQPAVSGGAWVAIDPSVGRPSGH